MKSLLSILLVLLSVPLQAGSLVGTVRAEGKAGAAEAGADGKYDSRKYKFAERVDYAALRDFVVYIDGPVSNAPAVASKPVMVDTRRVTQKGAEFQPHVLPVAVGTTVEWPNHDAIFHNVFSMSDAKPFDLDLYKGNPPEKRVIFDKAGRVDVFCSIHSSMHCVVLVVPNGFFAKADEHGRYVIPDVPPGRYQVKAWHERLPPETREVTVGESGEVRVDFVLGIRNLPKY
ncbi:MAG: carboxypeptidase regulatory-like domain-containing protein [Verrucomicrobiota bacterium]